MTFNIMLGIIDNTFLPHDWWITTGRRSLGNPTPWIARNRP